MEDVFKYVQSEEVTKQEQKDKDFIEDMKRKYLDNYNQFVGESPLAKDAEKDQLQTDFIPQMAVPVVHAFPDQYAEE